MTVKEARKLIAVFMVTYPNYKLVDVDLAAATWASTLEDYTWDQVNLGFKAYARENTSGFAPVPGQIVEKIKMLTQPRELNEMEAWSLVSKALRNSAYNSIEEFAKLPELVQQAVGQPSQLQAWATDSDYNEMVASSNFIKCYRIVVQRDAEIKKMPDRMRRMIEQLNQESYSAQISDKNSSLMRRLSARSTGELEALHALTGGTGIEMTEKHKQRLLELGMIR